MRRLIENNLIKHVRCQLFIDRKGPGLNFYSLTHHGAKYLDLEQFIEPVNPTSTNLLHYYGINTAISAFDHFSNKASDFHTDYLTAKEIQIDNAFFTFFNEIRGKNNDFQFIIPDFIISFGTYTKNKLIFGELDTGTEPIHLKKNASKSIENKFKSIAGYQSLNIQNFFQPLFKFNYDSFTYLHITNGSSKRIHHIIKICQSLANLKNVYVTDINSILPIRSIKKGKLFLSYDQLFAPVWIDLTNGNNTSFFQ